MAEPRLVAADLTIAQDQLLRNLESAFGCRIIAYRQEARLAELSPQGYAQLHKLELELGISLVAFEPSVRFTVAQLSRQQMERLSAVERELGLVLVAHAQERASPVAAPPPTDGAHELANLTEEQFAHLHSIEEQTGLVLMAYQT